MHTLAVSYLEWLRWVSTGWLRCNDRVVYLDDEKDQTGFDQMMDRAPDMTVSDDQGYLIALLDDEYIRVRERKVGCSRGPNELWLSMSDVLGFYPLSERGTALLQADAERANISLSEPRFQPLWEQWSKKRSGDESHWKGLSFCKALLLSEPNLERLDPTLKGSFSDTSNIPDLKTINTRGYDDTMAFGWVAARCLLKSINQKASHFFEANKIDIAEQNRKLQVEQDISQPLLTEAHTPKYAESLKEIIRNSNVPLPSFETIATTLHYCHLLRRDKKVNVSSLVQDLMKIYSLDRPQASISAYFIGMSMENVAVSNLLYRVRSKKFPVVKPQELPFSADLLPSTASPVSGSPVGGQAASNTEAASIDGVRLSAVEHPQGSDQAQQTQALGANTQTVQRPSDKRASEAAKEAKKAEKEAKKAEKDAAKALGKAKSNEQFELDSGLDPTEEAANRAESAAKRAKDAVIGVVLQTEDDLKSIGDATKSVANADKAAKEARKHANEAKEAYEKSRCAEDTKD